MSVRTLNPVGSDAVALARVIAKRARRALTGGAEYLAIAVTVLCASFLVAVIFAVNVDYEVVAVTPGGMLMPLVQLDKKNEKAQRALLGEARADEFPASPANPPSPPVKPSVPSQKAQQRKASSSKQ